MEDKHLFFLVHGLGGNPRHLKSLEKALVEEFQEDTLVHVAQSNSGFNTMDGAVVGANRLYKELLQLLTKLAEEGTVVTHISIIGYSFGGILSRYLIGLLEELNFFETTRPFIFATFATPHLGSIYPSNTFKARVFNFLGSKMLGLTGRDLFYSNDLLNRMADPNSLYFQGLKRFQHLYLFANCAWDRTVPFWTSYITTSNPFKRRDQLNLKYYDHLSGQSKEGYTGLATVPFLVDMENSTFSESKISGRGLTTTEKRQRLLILCLLPVFLPILMVVLSVGTVVARIKACTFDNKKVTSEQPVLFKKYQKAISRNTPPPSEFRRLENRFNEDLADVAGQAMEDMLLDTNSGYGNGNITMDDITKGPPKPAAKMEGLASSTPWQLHFNEQTLKNIDSLNTLPWQKYAVKLLHFNAHAVIVDRRTKGDQGGQVIRFFARKASKLVYGSSENTSI